MVRRHGSLEKDDETNQAAWEAAKGAAWGSTKWGAFFAVAGGAAYALSPVYRGLTVPFKTGRLSRSRKPHGRVSTAHEASTEDSTRHRDLAQLHPKIMDVFWTLPPVTRTLTALAVAVSALGYGQIISLNQFVYYTPYVFTTRIVPQVWRIFTAFLVTKPKIGILLDPYFFYQYGSGLERESPRFSQPGDFFTFVVFVATVIVHTILAVAVPEFEEDYPCTLCSSVIRIILIRDCVATAGYGLGGYTFLPALTMAFAYIFAQDNPTRQVNFFILNFDAKYLPYALLFMTLVMDDPSSALAQGTGLIAAHLYDFLTRIWPTFGGGKNYIFTPQIVKNAFGSAPGQAQNRAYGQAIPGRATASSGASTGVSNRWGGSGPGRRLGE
ncbi:Der1-like family-domain-containing protein [Phaeosphaeriaceae sp. PMI808]|nr:Der1-like family-domain-containing protein [Phaeosphaeriaceae sp. PMI808]